LAGSGERGLHCLTRMFLVVFGRQPAPAVCVYSCRAPSARAPAMLIVHPAGLVINHDAPAIPWQHPKKPPQRSNRLFLPAASLTSDCMMFIKLKQKAARRAAATRYFLYLWLLLRGARACFFDAHVSCCIRWPPVRPAAAACCVYTRQQACSIIPQGSPRARCGSAEHGWWWRADARTALRLAGRSARERERRSAGLSLR
jgi:hypothetical protein